MPMYVEFEYALRLDNDKPPSLRSTTSLNAPPFLDFIGHTRLRMRFLLSNSPSTGGCCNSSSLDVFSDNLSLN